MAHCADAVLAERAELAASEQYFDHTLSHDSCLHFSEKQDQPRFAPYPIAGPELQDYHFGYDLDLALGEVFH